MFEMQAWLWTLIILLAAWFLMAEWHYYIVPGLDKNKDGQIADFIAGLKGFTLDKQKPLPIVNVVDLEQLSLPEGSWQAYGGVVDFAIENYSVKLNRITLVEGCRQNILVHAFTHYFQFEYEKKPAEYLATLGAELDAWAVTRAYLKKFHPYRYWILSVHFGVYCWWTSTPY